MCGCIILANVCIRVDESWFLDSVSVYDKHRQEVYEFLCKKWLAVMSDDKMTRRELSVSAFRKLEKGV